MFVHIAVGLHATLTAEGLFLTVEGILDASPLDFPCAEGTRLSFALLGHLGAFLKDQATSS
jgi:hypothetical protein